MACASWDWLFNYLTIVFRFNIIFGNFTIKRCNKKVHVYDKSAYICLETISYSKYMNICQGAKNHNTYFIKSFLSGKIIFRSLNYVSKDLCLGCSWVVALHFFTLYLSGQTFTSRALSRRVIRLFPSVRRMVAHERKNTGAAKWR